ncbi:MAG: AAA family ATPase, partial [Caulobacteraceae bacterium]
ALAHVAGTRKLAVVVGYAGSGKSAMLGVAREAWEAEGYGVRGAALSGIAAESLEAGSGIASSTLASLEHRWGQGRDLLTSRDVLVIDEAGMIGSRQMERVISRARDAGAKVVLVGDPEQLQAIEAGAAFRAIAEQVGAYEITKVRRQREDWQREATRALATGRTGEALGAYDAHGHVHAAPSREDARSELVDRWDRARLAEPDKSRIILAHTNAEARALNDLARARLRDAGELGREVAIKAERGERLFAPGDRIMFLRNERGLGVKNGTLGWVSEIDAGRIAARLDDGRTVAFEVKDYAHVDHGYAATIHKAQGVTVDQSHVLATPGLDRHGAYVALSRHRDRVELHYGRDDFTSPEALVRALSRERAKDMARDYQTFAERRGIDRDAARADHAPGTDLAGAREQAIRRHARAVSAIFRAQEEGVPLLADQTPKLQQARRELDAFDPHASRDIERAYKADPPLAHEAAGGRTTRAIRAMQMEAELRVNPALRADRFVETWQGLERKSNEAYRQGDMSGMRRIRDQMGAMAKSLERDPQLESILAGRKQQLGITFETGRSIGRSLAMAIGFDMGRGRGIGI